MSGLGTIARYFKGFFAHDPAGPTYDGDRERNRQPPARHHSRRCRIPNSTLVMPREEERDPATIGSRVQRTGIGAELADLPFVTKVLPVYTNIVIFTLAEEMPGDLFEQTLRDKGIRVSAFGKQTIRIVTHLDFTEAMLQEVIGVLQGLAEHWQVKR